MAGIFSFLKTVNLTNYWGKWYTPNEFYELTKRDYIIDFRLGGLVLGPSHFRGGIYMYNHDGSLFEMIGEMEGGEFIVNSIASQIHAQRLQEINADYSRRVPLPSQAKKAKGTIQVMDNRRQALLLSGDDQSSSFIINKVSTALHYEELCRINRLSDRPDSKIVLHEYESIARLRKLDEEGKLYRSVNEREQIWRGIQQNTIMNSMKDIKL